MSEEKATKPKFLSPSPLKIEPGKLTRPVTSSFPWNLVEFSATVFTSGNRNRQIDYVVSRPDGKEDSLLQRAVAEGRTQNEGITHITYGISHDDPIGEYKVKAKIRHCDEDCERTGSFIVEKDPREA